MANHSVKIDSLSFMRRSRVFAIQALFQFEFYDFKKPIETILSDMYEIYKKDYNTEDIKKIVNAELAENLIKTAILQKKEIFNIFSPFLNQNWQAEDISLNLNIIIRLATAEMLNTSTDLPIIINEYIEITKAYESNKEARFVNSILQQIGDVTRPKQAQAADSK